MARSAPTGSAMSWRHSKAVDQVVPPGQRRIARVADVELHPIGEAGRRGIGPRQVNRGVVQVEAVHQRLG